MGLNATHAVCARLGTWLKNAWRDQITRASPGKHFAKSIRAQVCEAKRPSLNVAALASAKVLVIVWEHEVGPLIRSRNGFGSQFRGKPHRAICGGVITHHANKSAALAWGYASYIVALTRTCSS
jgi:hypothetical protein